MAYQEQQPPTFVGVLERYDPPPTLQEIRAIVDANPGIAGRYVDLNIGFSCTPVEIAVSNKRVDASVVAYLIEQWPQSLRDYNYINRDLPIHLACQRGCSLEVLQTLVKHYPESLSVEGSVSTLPLHRLFWGENVSLDSVQFLVEKYPSALEHPDEAGMLPVHLALQGLSAPHEIVKYLVEACPQALLVGAKRVAGHNDDEGSLPIHFACTYSAPVKTIQYLIEKNPATLRMRNRWGKLPLESACTGGSGLCSLNVLDLLLKKTPAELINPSELLLANVWNKATQKDNPHANLHVIEYLLEKFPFLARFQTPAGELPLHVACRQHGKRCNIGSDHALECIIHAEPAGLFVQSSKPGRTPFQELKINGRCSSSVIARAEQRMRAMLCDAFQNKLPEDAFHHVLKFQM